MTQEKILARITKLLALAGSSNENEAALAAEKAHELLAEHNLSLMDVEGHKRKEDSPTGHATASTNRGAPWVRQLWAATSRLYFCNYVFARGGSHKTLHWVIGEATNVATACHMAEYLTNTVARLSVSQSSASRSSFIKGCAGKLEQRLLNRRKEAMTQPTTQSSGGLPAVYNMCQKQNEEYLKNLFDDVKSTKRKDTGVSDLAAYREGLAAGEKVGLDTPISSRQTRGLLA